MMETCLGNCCFAAAALSLSLLSNMEDNVELELALSNQIQDYSTKKKRSFHESFSDVVESSSSKRTLPLLIWDHQTLTTNIIIREEDASMVVGWPPVKMKKSMYVKVEMEGVGIARKIDLSLHHSYQSLQTTLAAMFGKPPENFKLTYQDEEHDWLLAGDVPWRTFVGSVRRLKLLRKEL